MRRQTSPRARANANRWFRKSKPGRVIARKLLAESLEARHLMAAYISEVHFAPLFGDEAKHQYVELRGDNLSSLSAGTYLVQISSSDGVKDLGDIHAIFDLSNQQFGSNGMLVLLQSASSFTVDPGARVLRGTDSFAGLPGNIFSADAGLDSKKLRTGSNTYLLIQSNIPPLLTNDIDGNDDGTPDGAYLNWTILDGFTVFPWVENGLPQRAYAPIVFQDKGVGSGMPGATLVPTEALAYVGRIGQSTGYTAGDWLAGNTTEDGSATWKFQMEDGIFGVPRPRAYAGRYLDHIGGPNWVGSVSGSVFVDLNADGIQQAGENPIAGARVVSDLTGDSLPDLYAETIEPNAYALDRDLTNISYNATLTTAGTDNLPHNFNVRVVQRSGAPTGQHVFSHAGVGFFNDIRRLRTDFYRPARSISSDFIGNATGTVGRLEIFNAANESLGFVQATSPGSNQIQRLTMTSETDSIAWAVAYSEGNTFGVFDTLSFVLAGQSTTTDSQGRYFMQPMTPGNYTLSVTPPANYDQVFPSSGSHAITINKYESYPGRNFGFLGDRPPILNDQTFNVSEANVAGNTLATLQFSKGYPSQVLTATITAGDPTGLFAVNPSTGVITLNRTELDFETKNSFSLTVTLADSANPNLNDSATIDLVISDANEAPVVQSISRSLIENSPVGTVITTMSATDPDAGVAGQVVWSIVSGNTGSAFAINANTGEVRVNDASKIDFESNPSFNLTIRATDRGTPTKSGDGNLVVNLLNVNEPPVLQAQPLFVKESSLAGTLLGTINAIDPDANETLQWQITGGTGATLFQIAADGKLTVSAGAAFDFEQTNQYDLVIKVTDAGTLTDTRNFVVAIQDDNDAPLLTSPTSFTTKEDTAEGAVVARISAVDQDAGQVLTYSILGSAASKFIVDPTSGEIRVAGGTVFDFESAQSLTLTVRATDNGSPSQAVSALVTLQITDVNEAPSLAAANFEVAENSPPGTSLGNLTASDPDAGDKLTYEIVQQSASWLTVDAATGQLAVATGAVIDFETQNTNDVIVRVTDAGGLKAERSLQIRALDRNDPPTLANPIPNRNAKAQTAFTYTIPGNTFIDQDAGDSLRLAMTNGAGFPLPSWLTFTASTGVLSGTPTVNDGGALELRVIAVDSQGASTSTRFTVTVDANLFTWHNPTNPFDTNGNNSVSPVDALIVINYLNSGKPRDITPGSAPTMGFLDTSKNNPISPLDALLVINELNRRASGEGEAAAQPASSSEEIGLEHSFFWDYSQQLDDRKRQEELLELLAGEFVGD
ncbi:MAG: cadherin domain-containing protein [Pirellulaceae bacterium]|nr:cadherin domain-containing protein [Pirellulaceae bacterium]